MWVRVLPATVSVALLLGAPALADDAVAPQDVTPPSTTVAEESAEQPASRLLPALAAGGTAALVSIPASALGAAGGTAVCLYTLGFGGVVGLPFVVAPLVCGLCGGGVGTLVGVWAAGDDTCQPLWLGAGAGIGALSGGLGLVAGAVGIVAAWQPIYDAFGTPGGSMYSHIDELALYGALIAGGATAVLLALGSAGVATLVALMPPRPAPEVDTTVADRRVRMVALDDAPAGRLDVIAY